MKTVSRLALLLLLTASLWAGFEPIGVEVTREPQMPAVLRMNGLSNGRVIVVVDVDAEGKLADWLVVGASHRELIRPCLEAVQDWRFRAARYDGLPVLAQLQISIDISQSGAVISRTAAETTSAWMEQVIGHQPDYQACPPGKIDRPPVAITTVSPIYPSDAAKEGVRGRVKVFFYVDEQGAVRMPAVPAETHPYLASVALKALREWKFEPATCRGKPVLVAVAQEFKFGVAD